MSAERSRARNFFGIKMTSRQIVTRGSAAALLMLAGVVGLGAAFQERSTQGQSTDGTVLSVETVAINPVDSIQITRTYSGVIKASRTSELSFERTAKVTAINVEEGSRVQRGDHLAQLDKRNLEVKKNELQAQRDGAAALLSELTAGPRKEVIAAARAEVEQFKSELALQNADLRRSERLIRQNAVSLADHDRDKYGSKAQSAKLEAAQHRLSELEAGTRKEKIDAQMAIVAQLDAALADVAIDIKDSTLTAPFSGIVSKRFVDEGTIVSPGSPVIRLVEDQKLEAWIGLPVDSAIRIRPGRDYDIRVGKRNLKAKASGVLPELDATTRTRTVVFKIDSSQADQAVPGEIVRIALDETNEMDGYWIPTTSLARGSRGLWSAYVVEEDADRSSQVVARRDVEVLHTSGDRSFVRGTLQPGDQVIASGVHRVVVGQVVQVARSQHLASAN